MCNKHKKILISALALMLAPATIFAQGGAVASHGGDSAESSTTLLILATVSAVLLFVIYILSNISRQFTDLIRDKMKMSKKITTIVLVIAGIFISNFVALDANAADSVKHIASTTIVSGISDSDFYMIMTFICIEFIIVFGLLYNISRLQRVLRKNQDSLQVEAGVTKAVQERSWFWDEFNSAVSLEREKDVLLDHNYDGIRELDNSLPPWWKYGFYFTIVFAIVYFCRYQVFHMAPNPTEEYNQEMAMGEEQQAAYLAKAGGSIDENNVTLLTDAASLAEAKGLFLKNCLPCHLADGGGIVGPNLTDDYWLHGCGVKDIFKTIKYGYMEKGMKSWKDDFSPKQIQELASYVKSLRGTKPATPKAPQGELCTDGAAPAAAAATAPKADSAAKK